MENKERINMMNDDEPKSQKVYPCRFCGHSFNAAAPDDFYVLALHKECSICQANNKANYVKWNYECDNCHKMNHLYWHHINQHTSWESAIFRSKERQRPKYLDANV